MQVSAQLTVNGVVSLLLVHRNLGQPRSNSQQLGFDSLAELVLPVNLTFLLSAPINVVLEHRNTERISHIWRRGNKKRNVSEEIDTGFKEYGWMMTLRLRSYLCRRQFDAHLLKAEQTQCDFPWNQTSRFCHHWQSQLKGQWANRGHRPLGPSSPGHPAKNTRS